MTDRKLPKPAGIRAYLAAHGWTEEKPLPPAGTMFSLPGTNGSGDPVTVFVPNLERSPDYPLRVSEVVTTLAGVEQRPEGHILAELIAPDAHSIAGPDRATSQPKRAPRRPKRPPLHLPEAGAPK